MLIALWLTCNPLSARSAAGIFDFSPRCQQAYQHFMALRPAAGRQLLLQERSQHPRNLMPVYIEDYEDCLSLLFNGDPDLFGKRLPLMESRLAALKTGDAASPWHLFSQAGIYFHWALVQFRFGDNLKAALNFRRSLLLLRENQKKHPHFSQNRYLTGAQEAVLGTIPDDYKWIASLFGMKGDVRKGIAEMSRFLASSSPSAPLREEASILYVYLRYYLLSEQKEAWAYVNGPSFPIDNNLLRAFVRTNLAINFRKADAAIEALRQVATLPDYSKYPLFDYEMGTALLYGLDPQAPVYLGRFVNRFRGRYYIKDALAKMSYAYYLGGDKAKADECRRRILKSGAQHVDADKQAHRFAAEASWPLPALLQARLLVDGGYFEKALQRLHTLKQQDLPGVPEKLEYAFRLGRVYDELRDKARAIQSYQSAVALGRKRKEYFGARAALQLGLMYERESNPGEAIRWFRECLSMKGHDFQASIDQQAKAGLNRLNGK